MVFLYNLLDLKRTIWEGPELSPGKHTIVFDYKVSEPGLGKSGTGVLSVDGKEVARNSMEHGTPITFAEDETFDVGLDTRTGVALLEYRYDPPFKFTGTIDKLTFKLEPEPEGGGALVVVPRRALAAAALAAAEIATGMALLLVPSLVGQLLLGAELTGVAVTVARVAGIALIGIGGRLLAGHAAVGMLTYSAAVALYLAYLGFAGAASGILLWPAVVLHLILSMLLARECLVQGSIGARADT